MCTYTNESVCTCVAIMVVLFRNASTVGTAESHHIHNTNNNCNDGVNNNHNPNNDSISHTRNWWIMILLVIWLYEHDHSFRSPLHLTLSLSASLSLSLLSLPPSLSLFSCLSQSMHQPISKSDSSFSQAKRHSSISLPTSPLPSKYLIFRSSPCEPHVRRLY